jgi:hypothetical protein
MKQRTELREIKNTILNWQNSNLSRKEKSVIDRLWIGHSGLTHKFFMAKEEPIQCTSCKVTLTIKHIITEYHQ